MKNFFFYIATVFIWGSTWIGIKLQLGVVEPVVSVAYRFAIAAVLLFFWCFLLRMKMQYSRRQHLFMAAQGLTLFGFNYLLFYLAELHINSGLAAVLFSTILLMNVINGAIFLGKPIEKKVLAAGFLGLTGIVLVFLPEITSFSIANHGVQGVLLCLVATFLASLGNIISAYNQKTLNLPVVQTNAFGMGYGATAMAIAALLAGKTFLIDMSFIYLGSLFYLALFGSVIAFGCYLALVGNIGADRAAYATLLFPLVALFIATVWEGYSWSPEAIGGVALILAGNVIMVHKPGTWSRWLSKAIFRPVHIKK